MNLPLLDDVFEANYKLDVVTHLSSAEQNRIVVFSKSNQTRGINEVCVRFSKNDEKYTIGCFLGSDPRELNGIVSTPTPDIVCAIWCGDAWIIDVNSVQSGLSVPLGSIKGYLCISEERLLVLYDLERLFVFNGTKFALYEISGSTEIMSLKYNAGCLFVVYDDYRCDRKSTKVKLDSLSFSVN